MSEAARAAVDATDCAHLPRGLCAACVEDLLDAYAAEQTTQRDRQIAEQDASIERLREVVEVLVPEKNLEIRHLTEQTAALRSLVGHLKSELFRFHPYSKNLEHAKDCRTCALLADPLSGAPR